MRGVNVCDRPPAGLRSGSQRLYSASGSAVSALRETDAVTIDGIEVYRAISRMEYDESQQAGKRNTHKSSLSLLPLIASGRLALERKDHHHHHDHTHHHEEYHQHGAMAIQALVCFHGTGSKGQIFRVQLARLAAQLRDIFEFIYIDGPKTCAAGPGVLPTFAGEEPYYCWFGGHGSRMEEDLAEIDRAVQKGIKEWQTARREQGLEQDVEIVGGIGFSEGSLALAMMLWQMQQQANCTWPLRFAVLTCCFVSVAKASSNESRVLTVPSSRARRRYGCTPKAKRRAWVRARVASTYPLCTFMATVISAWGEHASWCASTAAQTAHRSSPSTPPTTCPPSLPMLPVSSSISARWLHVYLAVGVKARVKARSRPCRSSRRP